MVLGYRGFTYMYEMGVGQHIRLPRLLLNGNRLFAIKVGEWWSSEML